MKLKPRTRGLLILPLLGLLAAASGWLWQWPLALPESGAGAYRLVLDEAVYRHANRADLGDVDVLDADGNPVPATVFSADAPAAIASAWRALPWFALPQAAPSGNDDLRILSERTPEGRVLRVETAPAATADQAPRSWLLDASTINAPLTALRIRLAGDAPVDVRVAIDGSDDLNRWQTLVADAAIIRLTADGKQLQQTQITLPDHADARYLRIRLLAASARLPLAAVEAHPRAQAVAAARAWQSYPPRTNSNDRRVFEFEVDARAPFDRANILLPGNTATRWRLESRESPEQPWRLRAGPWTHYQLSKGEQSPAQAFAAVRDRQWRLTADAQVKASPQLELGWRPEVLVFVAAGQPPYRLVAGSAQHRRQPAPVGDLLVEMRRKRGQDWQPVSARIDGEGAASDAGALSAPVDIKRYALWGLLLLAAALVGGFALSLLRGRPTPPDADQGGDGDR
ncbi:MAG: DUF3999 family protein [Pseudomonadota bacterium]|nr:DUF3999 family protein [Pseudomonadota bacterium]